jgi:hypothetical protein
MKKVLVTILAFIYLSVSSGATINMHYCMGKLMNWDLVNKQENKCGTCGMEKSGHKGCCKDEQKIIQIGKDQKISESNVHFLNAPSHAEIANYPDLSAIHFSSILTNSPVAHAPPPLSAVSIYILNCNFRI